MTKLAGKEAILNNLSKLINQKSTSTTWPQELTVKNNATHRQISTCPKSFLVKIKSSSKSLLNVNLYTSSTFISHVACLDKTSNS